MDNAKITLVPAERQWVVIRTTDGITVAQGYKCQVCGVIGCSTPSHQSQTVITTLAGN